MAFFWTLVATVVVLGLCWRFLGAYMVAVYEGRAKWLTWVERPIYRALRVDSQAEQTWPRYATSVIVFSGVALLITYGIFRLQGYLPFNPNHFPAVRADTAWNTAVSFVTNTNWQSYSGETTMSYLSQMGALAVQNFLSAAVGMSVAVALIRGFARKGSKTIGNFWVDLVRSTVYILLPIAFVAAIVFMFQGAVQTLSGAVHVHNALDGVDQILQRGPIASQEVIKQLGTNGGGFFNANGAGPFENPTGVTNLLSILLILCIPVAFTYVFGKMVFSIRQGVAILAVMTVLFGGWLTMATVAEHQGSPAMAAAGISDTNVGNVEGKETRFGVPSSALYNVTSTQTSTGSVDSAADSYTPIGGFAMLTGMMLGEVSPGGVGTGLYSILLFAVITVFIGGLAGPSDRRGGARRPATRRRRHGAHRPGADQPPRERGPPRPTEHPDHDPRRAQRRPRHHRGRHRPRPRHRTSPKGGGVRAVRAARGRHRDRPRAGDRQDVPGRPPPTNLDRRQPGRGRLPVFHPADRRHAVRGALTWPPS